MGEFLPYESLYTMLGIGIIAMLSVCSIKNHKDVALAFVISLIGARLSTVYGGFQFHMVGMVVAMFILLPFKGIPRLIGLIYIFRILIAELGAFNSSIEPTTIYAMSESLLIAQLILWATLIYKDGSRNNHTISDSVLRNKALGGSRESANGLHTSGVISSKSKNKKIKTALKTMLLFWLVAIPVISTSEPLKLFTDIEYQNSFNGSSSMNPAIEGKSFEAAIGLKYKPLKWMQVQTGVRYYEEEQNLYGGNNEFDMTGYFIRVQTIHVVADF